MAIMIPVVPRDYDELSLEGEMFSALSLLPDDYYVIHSFKSVFVEANILHESETDFVVFNPNKGILCLEAKAGNVKYSNGEWQYASGKIMKHGGPYNQAARNKWNLLGILQNSSLKELQRRIKFLHAVWFPSVKSTDLNSTHFPAEFDRNITMTMEALQNPQLYLDKIFDIELDNHIQTDLSESEVKRLIREIICPEFNIFPASSFDSDLKKITFHRSLKEQQGILNYLVEQKSAVINGAAGTGKTMIAIEKAYRHAKDGEKVLFLCYNAYLKDHLERDYYHKNIDYYTIAGFACKLCKTDSPDFSAANDQLIDMYVAQSFPYMHVIVDEGQDFGQDGIEEANILQTIHDIILYRDDIGSFYIFYDKLQLIQGHHIPQYISDADCKLTLYRNCRNTENIATTSLKPLTERIPKLYEGAVKGSLARLHYRENNDAVALRVADIITGLDQEGINDVVILTCDTEERSCLATYVKNGKYKKKLFTTCRKFKGLEADAIVLIDIDVETFSAENVLRYYVGASRARIRLEMVTTMNDESCCYVLENYIHYTKKIKKPRRELALALNALPIVE